MENQEKIIIEADEDYIGSERESKPVVRVLSFSLGKEHYCIDIIDAKEVFKPIFITKVPNSPKFIAGVTNLHGDIIPLIDIRYFLGIEKKEGLESNKVIVTDITGSLIGVMVDDVNEVLEIEEEAIQPPLATLKGRIADFTKGQIEMNKDILVLLKLDNILNCDEIENMKKGA